MSVFVQDLQRLTYRFIVALFVKQALEREGVPTVFAYPGGASMEIHQALTRSDSIRNILCRHEQVRIRAWRACMFISSQVAFEFDVLVHVRRINDL